uniref:Putative plant transposon protein domain-containing protein n=1 Tax=Cannabis sativa TaxID=3483 RepID=A0A803Q0I8_CANSA
MASQRRYNEVYVRGVHVSIPVDTINNSFNLGTLGEGKDERILALRRETLTDEAIATVLGQDGTRLHVEGNQNQKFLYQWQLNLEAKAWAYIVNSRIMPTSHASTLDYERFVIVYAIMTNMTFDIGWVTLRNINYVSEMKTTTRDIVKVPMQPISRRNEFSPASYTPPEAARKHQKGDALPGGDDDEEEEHAEAGASEMVPPLLQIELPLDSQTQGTYDRLDYIIR